ncbi:MAG: hypothetical protein CMJ78_10060 [Planctomycetaceae bacterium]|nr:hypothetical protein [Planctomycetaceae bacterium]
MTEPDPGQDVSDYFAPLVQLAKRPVRQAQQESRDMGVANVYSINGKLLYEHPNGELRLTKPKGSNDKDDSET